MSDVDERCRLLVITDAVYIMSRLVKGLIYGDCLRIA